MTRRDSVAQPPTIAPAKTHSAIVLLMFNDMLPKSTATPRRRQAVRTTFVVLCKDPTGQSREKTIEHPMQLTFVRMPFTVLKLSRNFNILLTAQQAIGVHTGTADCLFVGILPGTRAPLAARRYTGSPSALCAPSFALYVGRR